MGMSQQYYYYPLQDKEPNLQNLCFHSYLVMSAAGAELL